MKEDTRRRWVKELRLLAPGPAFSEFDVVLTAIAGALIEGSTTHRASQAFSALRPEIRRAYLAGQRDLWVVIPTEGDDFRLAGSAAEAASHAADLPGPTWTVPLASKVELAQSRFARLSQAAERTDARVHELRSTGETA